MDTLSARSPSVDRLEAEAKDQGHSPAPFTMYMPAALLAENEEPQQEDEELPSVLDAALNFTTDASRTQGLLPRVQPEALEGTLLLDLAKIPGEKPKALPPSQMPADIEDVTRGLFVS